MEKSQLLMGTLSTRPSVLGNLVGSALSLQISALYQECQHPLVVIASDQQTVMRLEQELSYLMPKESIMVFRDYETLPYEMLSAHQDIISSRLEFLAHIPYLAKGIVLTSINAIMQRLCPSEYLMNNSLLLKKGDTCDLMRLRESLVERGYLQVEKVLSHGEFAVRGDLIDLFPMGYQHPFRINVFDIEIENIAIFDVQTQISSEQVDEINLLPANEFSLNKDSIALFRIQYREAFEQSYVASHIVYREISQGNIPAGIEYYLPLFFKNTSTFFDYIHPNSDFVLVGDFDNALVNYEDYLHQRQKTLLGNRDRKALPVERVFLSATNVQELLSHKKRITLRTDPLSAQTHNYQAPCIVVPNIAFDHHKKNRAENLIAFVEDFCINHHGRILISALSEGRRQSLRDLIPHELVKKFGLTPASNFNDFLASSHPMMMTIAPFDQGVIFDNHSYQSTPDSAPLSKHCHIKSPLAILTETELLGFKVVRARRRSQKAGQIDQDTIITNLAQLSEGQIVVHIDHGIGRYRGLKTEVINGIEGEYLTIEYLNGDMLSIPITALNKVARYSGEENPPLSKLGSDAWSKKKAKAAQKVSDIAAELLDIYAQRELKAGFAFKVDEHALEEFTSSFPYEETEDQLKAIEQTLEDMKKPIAMDRLICGDVGFGKTEVALRAAFVAAYNGKQVALLAPTTILAEQHYQNFKERFATTAINVDLISRFKSTKEQNEALKRLSEGQIDIIIGTHSLLSKKVQFHDLGLLIIDEEHRFGVRQKEKLKSLRSEVDLLTLTATPIPRTLNMALEGMRELSIIATPPEHRLAVKTFIHQETDELSREAIMRELRRGGQVYYLHNNVSTMELKAEQLKALVPEAKIEIAHGQMDERDLQRVMQDFNRQRFNVLLCSTIIENGLDIPSANTIIIDRADLLGLAQLHQIRGRVGRSHHQAYAYFFTPPKDLLTKDAQRRLEAIASIDELGAGFVLASHDLEIRGAGELLGDDQSGQIESIGFSLYMDMLNAAVSALKEGREPTLSELYLNECEIDLHIPALLPESYIRDVNTRLSTYKRIASCANEESLEELKIELIDRFGSLPEESINLFTLSKLKLLASSMGINKIRGDHRGATIEFKDNHKVSPHYLLNLVVKSKHNEYRISKENALRYNLPESPKNSRIKILSMILNALRAHSTAA